MINLANWILLGIQFIMTTVAGVIAFFLKRELDRCERNEQHLHEFEHEVTTKYVQKSDFNRSNSEIMKKLDDIQDLVIKIVMKTE